MTDLNQLTEKGPVRWLVLFLQGIAAITLFALMMITCIDVVGRYVFNSPLTGSTELTEIAVGIVVFSVFPILSWRNEHVVVDILDGLFSARMHLIRSLLINLIVAISLYFLAGRIYVLGMRSLSYQEVTEYLHIPTGWMMIFFAVMCWLSAFMVITLGMWRSFKAYQLHLSNLPMDAEIRRAK